MKVYEIWRSFTVDIKVLQIELFQAKPAIADEVNKFYIAQQNIRKCGCFRMFRMNYYRINNHRINNHRINMSNSISEFQSKAESRVDRVV